MPKITPAIAVALLTAVVTLAVSFGAPLNHAQEGGVLAVGGSLATILLAHGLSGALKHLTPQTVTALVAAIIGLALSFGLPITPDQSTQILNLTALVAGLLLVHGVVHTAVRDRRDPEGPTPTRSRAAR